MSSKTFENRFDMEEYISKRALEIENLEERSLYKEISQTMILDMNNQLIESLDRLDEKLFDDLKLGRSDLGISITMIERNQYDATDDFMFPIINSDINKKEIDCNELTNNLTEKIPMALYDIYIALDYLEMITFEKQKREFKGTIKTDKSTYNAIFIISKSTKYLEAIKEVYEMFGRNKLNWNAVCTAHLNKIFTVNVVSVDKYIEEPIECIVVDFEEFEEKISYDIFPVWNMQMIKAKTNAFPKNLIRYNVYEHAIYLKECKESNQYLVANLGIDVERVDVQNGYLVVTCNQSRPVEWELLRIHHNSLDKSHNYPILTNLEEETMMLNFAKFQGNNLKTRAEISRIINALPYSDIIEYESVRVEREYIKSTQTYDMNNFLIADFGENLSKDTLVLSFKRNEKFNYLTYDIMSFLVTKVSQTFHEYQCIGILN